MDPPKPPHSSRYEAKSDLKHATQSCDSTLKTWSNLDIKHSSSQVSVQGHVSIYESEVYAILGSHRIRK